MTNDSNSQLPGPAFTGDTRAINGDASCGYAVARPPG